MYTSDYGLSPEVCLANVKNLPRPFRNRFIALLGLCIDLSSKNLDAFMQAVGQALKASGAVAESYCSDTVSARKFLLLKGSSTGYHCCFFCLSKGAPQSVRKKDGTGFVQNKRTRRDHKQICYAARDGVCDALPLTPKYILFDLFQSCSPFFLLCCLFFDTA